MTLPIYMPSQLMKPLPGYRPSHLVMTLPGYKPSQLVMPFLIIGIAFMGPLEKNS